MPLAKQKRPCATEKSDTSINIRKNVSAGPDFELEDGGSDSGVNKHHVRDGGAHISQPNTDISWRRHDEALTSPETMVLLFASAASIFIKLWS
jgi:hypothetical protein